MTPDSTVPVESRTALSHLFRLLSTAKSPPDLSHMTIRGCFDRPLLRTTAQLLSTHAPIFPSSLLVLCSLPASFRTTGSFGTAKRSWPACYALRGGAFSVRAFLLLTFLKFRARIGRRESWFKGNYVYFRVPFSRRALLLSGR